MASSETRAPAPPEVAARFRALVIEDNVALAENLGEVLSDEGYDVRVVNTARQAFEVARAEGFDLALLDVRLPDTVGTELLVQLKEVSPHSEVIVVSGNATIESAVASVRGGAFAYVLKPVAMENMLRTAALAMRQVVLRREREALVEELRRSEQRYRTVVEVSPSLIVEVDGDGMITLVNTAVERATGYPRKELLGKPFTALSGAGGSPGELESGDSTRERPLATRDGGERLIEWRYKTTGGIAYVVGNDVTETRSIERRARAAEHLAMVGELTAGLAHEIRNPLNSALLELKVLMRRLARSGDERGVASTDVVRGELERLERLLADFLWFARPRAAAVLDGDLTDTARGVVRVVTAEAGERNIALTTDFDAEPCAAAFDEDRVRQVVFNLIRNAMEALEGGGAIVVRTRLTRERAELLVEDNGPGIRGDPRRVFMPFHTTKAKGTGLGLTIAQRIANDHGGELSVESAPGRTVFTLALPRNDQK